MPILLNVLIGVPQMLSNIQMILICVAVSCGTPRLFACRDERRLTMLLFSTDRCPSRAEHVPGAARERLALSPPAQRAKGTPGQWPLTASGIWFPRYPRVALCHGHVSLPSFSSCLSLANIHMHAGRSGTCNVTACRFPRWLSSSEITPPRSRMTCSMRLRACISSHS